MIHHGYDLPLILFGPGRTLFSYLFVLGQLQEHGGERAGALVSYRRLLREAAKSIRSIPRSMTPRVDRPV
jgi:hypothetical protein